jgi:large subunit ribosomal protein L22
MSAEEPTGKDEQAKAEKPAAEKAPAVKAPAVKAAASEEPAEKPAAKKKAAAAPAAAKESGAKEPAEKKPAQKKPTAKKPAAESKAKTESKPAESKPAAKKGAAEEPKAAAQEKAKAAAESKAKPKAAAAAPVSRKVVRAQARYVRTSARKARMVCGHLRGKSVSEARAILAFTPRQVARDWSKLLESAVANAENNHELLEDDLLVREAYADEGPTIKRFRPRAMGRATPIRKRTSHLTITLSAKQ